ncbi:MFS transporter [Myroides marinus]|uniref:MFS transporter n=1 Tax=Myroides marinus TaxID=703342 RepID=UPI002575EC67|nr:MFS transporter [Myroides marinus]MDM1362405.1 MFS transporter [Myroides marinus]MDM1369718.1 MFS transporter [Myroides marinus]MDM1376730.1 MFS transporter [Myroides marinus]MDM1384083.1 MFS transporter [Myroides marinus]MDM1405460.1 MFS transporter [Myroides marinus]
MTPTTTQSKKQYNKIRLAVSLFFFSHGLILSSWASRIPSIKTQLNISEAELGTLLLLMPIGQISTMPITAKLVDKYGSKSIVKYGFLLYPLILLIIGLSTSYTQLAISLFFFGIAGNLCNISINTQGVELESLMHKPMMSSFHGAWSISGFVGALIGLLILNLNLTTFTHFSIIAVIIVFLWGINIPSLITTSPIAQTSQAKESIFKNLDKTLVLLGIIGFLSMAIEGAMFDWSGVYFQEIVKAPEQLVIIGYTSFILMMAIGRFLGDYLIVRLGRQRVIQICGTLMSTGLIISVFFPSLVVCTLAFMMVGLGGSCSVPTIYGVAGKHNKVSASVALTLVSTISFFGFLIGPPVIGFIAEVFDLRYSYFLFALFGIIMVIMASRLRILKEN